MFLEKLVVEDFVFNTMIILGRIAYIFPSTKGVVTFNLKILIIKASLARI